MGFFCDRIISVELSTGMVSRGMEKSSRKDLATDRLLELVVREEERELVAFADDII